VTAVVIVCVLQAECMRAIYPGGGTLAGAIELITWWPCRGAHADMHGVSEESLPMSNVNT
jgi:hypothetical protein